MRTVLGAAVAALVLTGACTACTGRAAPREGGPVTMGGTAGTLCMPTKPGSPVTYGGEVVKNSGSEPVRLERVSLVGARATHLEEAFIVPIEGGTLVGSWTSWPPPRAATTTKGVRWGQRKPAAGMLLPPHRTRDFNLVLHATTNEHGSPRFAAVRVVYTADGTEFAEESSTEVLLRRRCH